MRSHTNRLAVALATGGLLLALVEGSAQAATVVSQSGGTLSVAAAAGKTNRIDIRTSSTEVFVTDYGDKPAAGSGCSVYDSDTVSCPEAGGSRLSVSASDLNDTVTSTVGRDTVLLGGAGNDTLTSGAGDDVLDGGTGADALTGGQGRDGVDYGARTVAVTVTAQDQLANDGAAGEGDNVDRSVEDITGGAGNDSLTGTNYSVSYNDDHSNRLEGGAGNDVLDGLGGDDVLVGGPGNDTQRGGPGSDRFLADAAADGADVIDGGSGPCDDFRVPYECVSLDQVSYASRSAAVTVDLDGTADDGTVGEGDRVGTDVEVITGGAGNDSLTGNGAPNDLIGRAGNDTLHGLGGADLLWGSAGNDTLNGDGDDDTFYAEDGLDGADTFNGGSGAADRVTYWDRNAAVVIDIDGLADDGTAGEGDNVRTDVERVTGGSGDDTLTGSAAADHLDGHSGEDTLNGLAGDDVLAGGYDDDLHNGGDGQDTFVIDDPCIDADCFVGDGADTFNGGPGSDGVSYAERTERVTVDLDGAADDGKLGERDNVKADVERVTGGAGSDLLTGNTAANQLYGGPGGDALDGLGGGDHLWGQDGADQLDAGAGSDSLNGGTGNDELYGADGVSANDALNGYSGVDSCAADRSDSQASCEDSSTSGL